MKRARAGTGTDKKLRVCDVCGSFLSLFDSDKRLTDHFMGKQHVGFQVNPFSFLLLLCFLLFFLSSILM
jgi:hypothetical protein